MSSIYFIRHGQTSLAENNYDTLSTLGESQAKITANYLIQSKVVFDAVYSGSLMRQRETAKHVSDNYQKAQQDFPAIVIDDRLNQLQAEDLATHLSKRLTQVSPYTNPHDNAHTHSRVKGWMHKKRGGQTAQQKNVMNCFNFWQSQECVINGLEAGPAFHKRVIATINSIMRTQGPDKTIAVFTSSGVIAAAVQYILGLPADNNDAELCPVINASITHCSYHGNKISLSYYNDHSFLRLMGDENTISVR